MYEASQPHVTLNTRVYFLPQCTFFVLRRGTLEDSPVRPTYGPRRTLTRARSPLTPVPRILRSVVLSAGTMFQSIPFLTSGLDTKSNGFDTRSNTLLGVDASFHSTGDLFPRICAWKLPNFVLCRGFVKQSPHMSSVGQWPLPCCEQSNILC